MHLEAMDRCTCEHSGVSQDVFFSRMPKGNTPRQFYELWAELHTKKNTESEWFESWIEKVPQFDCGCRSWIRDYIANNPPRFNDWFAYSHELHNSVNTKLHKPQQSLDDAKACWLGIAPRTKPRLVITIATGAKFVELLGYTRPLMEAYAARCNADFIALTNQQYDQWQREKFRVYEFAQQYEQTLFLDSDVVIRPDCPDLFSLYASSDVAMHNDLPKNPSTNGQWKWQDEYYDMLRSQSVKRYEPEDAMWNTGVVLTSKRGASIWKPPEQLLPDHHCSEQFFIQHNCKDFSVANMDTVFNWQYWFPDFKDGVDAAKIVHLANCPNKTEYVKQYV